MIHSNYDKEGLITLKLTREHVKTIALGCREAAKVFKRSGDENAAFGFSKRPYRRKAITFNAYAKEFKELGML